MFHFTGSSDLIPILVQDETRRDWPAQVTPFGNPRIVAHVQLPAAYRSLSRPSSPVSAKASTVRPY
jgi:hypothetical protein